MIEKRLELLDLADNDYFSVPYGAYEYEEWDVESEHLVTEEFSTYFPACTYLIWGTGSED